MTLMLLQGAGGTLIEHGRLRRAGKNRVERLRFLRFSTQSRSPLNERRITRAS